ncbi:elongation of very long chain fatty acids protein [Trichonephila clavipes]|nr:elongation of very long chain fatty acids protein [Trichonephila clavipes]
MELNSFSDFLFTTDFKRSALVSNPYISFTIVFLYLLFVLWIGPAFMKSQKPYKLKKTLIFYNFLQSALNGYVFYEALYLLFTHWHMRCMMKNHPHLPHFLKVHKYQ